MRNSLSHMTISWFEHVCQLAALIKNLNRLKHSRSVEVQSFLQFLDNLQLSRTLRCLSAWIIVLDGIKGGDITLM